MTATPHDALFKAAFESPAHAGALFRSVLPDSVVVAVDWTTMSPEPGSYVDPRLGNSHSDLLFSVWIGRAKAYLYLLLEHQSSNDDAMPLRVLEYVTQISRRHRKQHGLPLPIVIPTVVSHAPGGWTAATRFEELLEPRPASIPELVELVPRLRLIVEDISGLSNEQLRARALAAFPKLALWALRDARNSTTLLDNLQHWVTTVEEALEAPTGIEAVAQVFRYIALVCGDVKFDDFRARIEAAVPAAEEATMTMAEELIQRGLEQGVRQGEQRVLAKLIHLKFGELPREYAERLAAASVETLERYSARILGATTLAEVFAEPG